MSDVAEPRALGELALLEREVLLAVAIADRRSLSTYEAIEGACRNDRTKVHPVVRDLRAAGLLGLGRPIRVTAAAEELLLRAGIVLPAREAARRRCLRCCRDFGSIWAGNRICDPCKKTAEWEAGF